LFCFDNIAKHIVGKPCDALIKSINNSGDIPPDHATIVALKFTFAISINKSSYAKKVFNIKSILVTHARQHTLSQIRTSTKIEGPDFFLLTRT
jgi:hypothetical protein